MWDVNDVVKWATGVGIAKEITKKISELDIDGRTLTGLVSITKNYKEFADEFEHMGIPRGAAVKFFRAFSKETKDETIARLEKELLIARYCQSITTSSKARKSYPPG
eukprot:TRINITY_DN9841_c0_g1_i1.p1 TRINITY_DN9841_c0_g1~~TRINITY_DN9841_c0_g1_i1.p1  ORF type:complete len:107 (-),score=11.39 TRINITY_DN9841_c0_g1_i1:206-526(-)